MQEPRGLTGLANLGNTCFMNSCMQLLSNTPELNKILDTYDKEIKKNALKENIKGKMDYMTLLKEWKELKDLMWSKNCIISPDRFQEHVQVVARQHDKDIFTGYAQNDLPEFLLFVLDTFHNALYKSVNVTIKGKSQNETDQTAIKCYNVIKTMYEKEYSVILDHFYGMSLTYITDESGKVLSVTPEPYMIMNLPIPEKKKNLELQDCIDLYCQSEVLDGENMWFNSNTQEKQIAMRTTRFWSMPNIMIVDLKRFNNNNRKRQELINIPLNTIDLSKYVTGYNKPSYVYELYGVCNHEGGALGGHYTATIKKENGKWYNFNDTRVEQISEKKVISTKAYCLFFKKIS